MAKELTYFEVLKWASSFLDENKIETYVAEYLMLETKAWSKTDLLLNFKNQMPKTEFNKYQADLKEIVNHVPVQYIVGSCEFYGRRFFVNEATLIPRPETEELVDLILKENNNQEQVVVDIGTGTGVIALSLSLDRSNWQVSGLDISENALRVAQKNRNNLQVKANFLESDVLKAFKQSEKIDILVSNPPYISYKEWEEMDESVRIHEPKLALFAENEGLAIYQQIALEAKDKLAKDGKIYLEIGYLQGVAVSQIFKTAFPEKQISIIQDLNGLDRIVRVI